MNPHSYIHTSILIHVQVTHGAPTETDGGQFSHEFSLPRDVGCSIFHSQEIVVETTPARAGGRTPAPTREKYAGTGPSGDCTYCYTAI